MTDIKKKKDDELSKWLIVGGLFTLTLLCVDIWYSSFGSMKPILRMPVYILHGVLIGLWVIEMFHFNDPNYDVLRRLVIAICFVLMLIVGIHHGTERENEQVIIDSKENKAKDSIDQQRIKDSLIISIGDSKSHVKIIPYDNMGTMSKK